MQPSSLHREGLICPITGLSFFVSPATGKLYLLSGEDTVLNIHLVSSGTEIFVRAVPVFLSQAIHGISCTPVDGTPSGDVLVWGGRALARIPPGQLDAWIASPAPRPINGHGGGSRPLVSESRAPDWIHDAGLSPHDPSLGVIVTAHNEAVLIGTTSGDAAITFGVAVSPSRPMLYCARLRWMSSAEVMVAAGTVFGEIHVWKCNVSAPQNVKVDMRHVLRGHQGSIFGVSLCEFGSGAGKRTLLASCSDDRTIRVWDVTEIQQRDTRGGEKVWEKRLREARETGFGGDDPGEHIGGEEGASRLVATAMGHSSRIWNVRFLPSDRQVMVCSFGEDATVQKWLLNLEASDGRRCLSGTLRHQETRAAHEGKHIWSSGAIEHGQRTLIATGGADGTVAVANARLPGSLDVGGGGLVMSPGQVLGHIACIAGIAGIQERREADSFRQFAFVDDSVLLVMTTAARLLHGSIKPNQGRESIAWVEIPLGACAEYAPVLGASTVMRRVCHGTAVIGTPKGLVFTARKDGIKLVANVERSVRDIIILDPQPWNTPHGSLGRIHLLASLAGATPPILISLDPATQAARQEAITALDPRCSVTGAAMISGHIVIGSRKGFLAFLHCDPDTKAWVLVNEERRSRDAITCILPLPRSEAASSHFLTTSRDGKYRIYGIATQRSFSLALLHEEAPPLGPNLDSAWLSYPSSSSGLEPHVTIAGFRNCTIVVHDHTAHTDVLAVDCGGPHRTFTLSQGRSTCRIAFNRASSLNIYSQAWSMAPPSPPRRILKPGYGGREMRTVDSLALSPAGPRYVATSGEDTVVRVFQLHHDGGLRGLAGLRRHTAGVQRVQWFMTSDKRIYLFTSAGHEELFVWRIRTLGNGVGVVFEAALGDLTRDEDLRITGFDVEEHAPPAGGHALSVSVGFSNSAIKTFRYSDGTFELRASGMYTGACLTQLKHIQLGDSSLLTASTDGHVALWRLESGGTTYALARVVAVHAGSIKALGVVGLSTTARLMVVTGGDDNALAITALYEAGAGHSSKIVRNAHAHAASINGLALFGEARPGAALKVVTCSNDQRVRMWRIELDRGAEDRPAVAKVVLQCDQRSGVADAGDVCGLSGGDVVVVVGVGLEVWKTA